MLLELETCCTLCVRLQLPLISVIFALLFLHRHLNQEIHSLYASEKPSFFSLFRFLQCGSLNILFSQFTHAHILIHRILCSPCRHQCSSQGSQRRTCSLWWDLHSMIHFYSPTGRSFSRWLVSGTVSNATPLQESIVSVMRIIEMAERSAMNL